MKRWTNIINMMKVIIFLGFVGICLAQVVPEPRQRRSTMAIKTVPDVRQVVPEPRQARKCNMRFTFLSTGPQGILDSPNYPDPYPATYDMVFCLSSPSGTRISVSCPTFNVENATGCAFDKFYLSPSGDLELRDQLNFCGNSFPPQSSVSNSMIVGFQTDNSVQLSGYQCTFTVVQIPTTTTSTTTQASTVKTCSSRTQLTEGQSLDITSPSYPDPYPNNADQVQCFSSPAGTKMSVSCNPFNLEYAQDCVFDKLFLSLTGDLSFRDEKKFCGTNFTSQISTSNQLNVGFHSDASVQNPGYKCTVRVVRDGQTTTSSPIPTTAGPSCDCGARNLASRIVNGTQAKPAEFPWRCYLRIPSTSFFCGCSVISQNWILTARHCTKAVEGTPISVVVGAHIRNQVGANQRTILVDRIVDQPSYNADTQDNDMSLLHLSSPLTFNHDVSPICMPWHLTSKNFSGTSITASGWGTDKSGGSVQNTLMEVDLPVLTTEECQVYYGSSITDNMICTYAPGKDTCQGDSGGSIDYLDPNRNKYYGIGVVSWGIGCAGKNNPGVYAKVTKYLNWIETSTQGDRLCRA